MPVDPAVAARVILRAIIDDRFEGSINQAAKAWDVPQTTLNDYLREDNPRPMRLDTLGHILGHLRIDVLRFFRSYPTHLLQSGQIVSADEIREEMRRLLRRDVAERLFDAIARLNSVGALERMLERLEDAAAVAEAAAQQAAGKAPPSEER